MNLKVRLAFLYSFSVFIILLISAVSIYLLNENFRKVEFSKRLLLEAEESQLLFLSLPNITQNIAKELNQNAAHSLFMERVVIYNSDGKVLYKNTNYPNPKISAKYFLTAKNAGHATFNSADFESVLLYRNLKNRPIFVFVSASDLAGKRKNDNFRIMLTASVIGGILLSGLMAFFYVRQAMKPLERLKEQIEKINEANLTDRISVSKNNDEITQIARKFNAMLDRLKEAFEQRKNFVHHASHELRTPLTIMLSQTESALNKLLTPQEYRHILFSLKEDQQDLIDLTNSLLALSRYEKMNAETHWPQIRIDEVLYQIVDSINLLMPQAVINIHFETIIENEEWLAFEGNEPLIRSALRNLIKNAVQYSEDSKVKVTINASEKEIILAFDNTGKQLSENEQEEMFIPFFRGENAQHKKGHGLGLSIVQRIINVHKGSISYQTIEGNINRFTLLLPNI